MKMWRIGKPDGRSAVTLFGWRISFIAHRNEVWFRAYRVKCPFHDPFSPNSVDGEGRLMCWHESHRWVGTPQEKQAVEQWKASNRAKR